MELFIGIIDNYIASSHNESSKRYGFRYQSHFCEENIYCLVQDLLAHHQELTSLGIELHPIIISSKSKATPIWCQMAGDPVFWDYHVVLLVKSSERGKALVIDFDTTLSFYTPAMEYIRKSFHPEMSLTEEYQQLFRVLTASEYLHYFASDRSHMLSSGHALPPWPPVRGKEAKSDMNLMQYIDMSIVDNDNDTQYSDIKGRVVAIREFLQYTLR